MREAAPPSLWGWLLTARVTFGETVHVALADELALELVQSKGVLEPLAEALGRRLGRPLPIVLATGGESPSAPPAPQLELVAPSRSTVLLRLGRPIQGTPDPIAELSLGAVCLAGTVFRCEVRTLRRGGTLLVLDVTDSTDSVRVKAFLREARALPRELVGARALVQGQLQMDRLERQEVVVAEDLELRQEPDPDPGPPRYELHLHTTMSAMDGLIAPEALVANACRLGLAGFVVTDHGVVQAFPEVYRASAGSDLLVRYGMEAYVVDEEPVVFDGPVADLDTYVALDFETTSLSPRTGEVIEIGAVRFVGGEPQERFNTLVRPEGPLPDQVLALTQIATADLRRAPSLSSVLEPFFAFLGDAPLVAHNAAFDRGFLRALARRAGRTERRPIIDTLALGRRLHPELKSHRLPDLAQHNGVRQGAHHRATDDAEVSGRLLAAWLLRDDVRAQGLGAGQWSPRLSHPWHVLGIAVSREGLTELYRLVSQSHLEDFHRVPRLRRAALRRPGLIWGAPACMDGELVQAYLRGEDPEELARLARAYDFVEIPTPSRVLASADPGWLLDPTSARALVRALYDAAQAAGVLPVFGSDAHHLTEEDAVLRRIAARAQGVHHVGSLPVVTTRQALAELEGVVPDPEAVVLTHPRLLLTSGEDFPPVPEDLHTPTIPEAEERVREDSLARARALYPEPWPELIQQRLDKELRAILEHGYAVVYHVARLLVDTSLADGYVVGSRGSVGSSFVAYLLGITEVNPLPPHYLCPGCYVEFRGDVRDGFDLPPRPCPNCGRPLKGDGHDIPFETFLGFEGDKVPDIDLNFSGEEQPRIHRKAEEIFGRERVFRAGTIATVAERTAFGLVKGYLEEEGRQVRDLEVERLAGGLVGVKRTTGQHPGGVMIVPQDLDVHLFTPVQRPADDPGANTITTHFDYSAISSRLLKLDLLGHDDPTVLRLLGEMTGVDPTSVPMDDPATLSLFSGVAALGLTPERAGTEVGTLGVPEFGTRFVRAMLEDTRPSTFSDLVRISGLSHGTDVWTNNARDLIRSGTATLGEVIATRDDILLYLVRMGLEPRHAFQIMEQVRKGKGLKEEDRRAMRAAGVPEWYIRSCEKILYMFPKAHAAAYVTMAVRIAYFKVHHPAAFYASYFTVRAEEFDLDSAYLSEGELLARVKELEHRGREASARERALITHLEVVREMFARGLGFLPLSLVHSHPYRYWPEGDGLRPPFAAVPGLGRAGASALAEARREHPFRSRTDLRQRARLSRPQLEALERFGALRGLPTDDQITLF